MVAKRIRKNRFRRKKKNRSGGVFIGGVKIVAVGCGVSLLSVLFILCHDALTQWEAFAVERITLTGNQLLNRQQICDQSLIQLGDNILAVNLTAARKRLLAHPWIAEAYIQREIPDGIHFHIREHRAVAVIDLGRKFLLDESGTLFKELAPTDTPRLPVVHGLSYADLDLDVAAPELGKQSLSSGAQKKGGHQKVSPYEALVTLLKMGNEIDSVIPNTMISRIDVDRETGISVHLKEGPGIVKLGFGEFQVKYAVLQRLLAYLGQGPAEKWRKVETVDLNNLNRIVVRPLQESETGKG